MSDAVMDPPKRPRGRPRKVLSPLDTKPAKIDIGKALKLRLSGLSLDQVGQLCGGVSRQAIDQALAPFKIFLNNPAAVAAYQENKAPILEHVEMTLVTDLLDNDKRQKASLNNVAYAYQQVASSLRAERGPVGLQLSIPGSLQQAFTVAITVGPAAPIEKTQGDVIDVNPQPAPTTDCGLEVIENP